MPKIAPHYFNVPLPVQGDDHFYHADKYSYKADVSVTSEGKFSIRIKDELVPACEELAEKEKGVTVEANRRFGVTNVCAYDKTRAVDLIVRAIGVFSQAEITTEVVIVYNHDSEGKYFAGPNGEIAADGNDAEANFGIDCDLSHDAGWKWSKKDRNHFGTNSVYTFGIGAAVYRKSRIKRATGTTLRYDLYYGPGDTDDHHERKLWCQRLNAFALNFGLSDGRDHGWPHEIPYTEEAARFFFEAISGVCSLNERIRTFFADAETLQKAIESRAGLLLEAGK